MFNRTNAAVAVGIALFSLLVGGATGAYFLNEYHRSVLIDFGVAEYNAFNASFEIIEGRCIEVSELVVIDSEPES
jgi:hypothetical protein